MKKREDKKKDFEDLRKSLETVKNVFVTGYEKITVDQDFNLRKTIRGAGGSYKVIKNNVAEKASVGLPAEPVLQGLKGMTSLAWTARPSTRPLMKPVFSRQRAPWQGNRIAVVHARDVIPLRPWRTGSAGRPTEAFSATLFLMTL